MTARPVTIALRAIRCIEETDEVGADEPYVLVTACNLTSPVPQLETVLYGPWGDVDKDETHATAPIPPNATPALLTALSGLYILRWPFWSLDNLNALQIANPDQVIFIVSMMENDDGKPGAARAIVKGAATASLAGSNGQPRAIRVKKLIADINGALKIPTGAPNFDDLIGSRELRLTAADVTLTTKGAKKSLSLDFKGDGGFYRTFFDVVAA